MEPVQSKKSKLTLYIIIALFLGIGLGFVLNKNYVGDQNKSLAGIELRLDSIRQITHQSGDSAAIATLDVLRKSLSRERTSLLAERDKKVEPFSLLADIFLRLIKMIVAPLVFTTLVVGVAKLGDINSVGRIGAKTLI